MKTKLGRCGLAVFETAASDVRHPEKNTNARKTTVRPIVSPENVRVETPEPRENIERPTSNIERRSERGFALPFDVRRWMFDGECSSVFLGREQLSTCSDMSMFWLPSLRRDLSKRCDCTPERRTILPL